MCEGGTVKETHPTSDLIGWFACSSSLEFLPEPAHVAVHQELLEYNESLILLLLNPSPAAADGGGGKLPVAIYESTYETVDEDNKLGLKFVPLSYTIESSEAEMIAVDFVAKGNGNAGSATAAEEKEGTVKGKGKAKEETKEKEGAEAAEKVDMGTVNDEILSGLMTKRNAIVMLNARIKLLLSYLQNPPGAVADHQILREIKSLTHSRLPLLKPANEKAFMAEKTAQEADVNLVVLLGAVTKCVEDVRRVGRKSAGIEYIVKSGNKKSAFDEVTDYLAGAPGGLPLRRSARGVGMFGH